MTEDSAIVIGAGIGGLSAALDLASKSVRVTVFERAATPGGKMRRVMVGGVPVDAGPTVLTLPDVLGALFAECGAVLESSVTLRSLDVLARHAWSETERLDLFADTPRSAEAIGDLAGAAEARGYLAFSRRAKEIFETLDNSFMRAQRPNPFSLVARTPLRDLVRLSRISPFTTMWSELSKYFRDPRLRQLFGRYATYCGSSPFEAPATLILVAHAEQRGVWTVDGGMHRLAEAMAQLAQRLGVQIRYGAHVADIVVRNGRAAGVTLGMGEKIDAEIVIANADTAALAGGLFGSPVRCAVPPVTPDRRSLSAVTFMLAARARGFPLARHNVFFSRDYRAEFREIAEKRRLPSEPTVYVCAQDRDGEFSGTPPSHERLLCLVNAPATGDRETFGAAEIEQCSQRMIAQLRRCGLSVETKAQIATSPADFNALFPATGGALYGMATHGWRASFRRPGARSRIPGLYLAGGSVHPGPGVPMAAISGRLAAQCAVADLASMRRFRPPAMPGGISTHSAMTAPMASP